MRTALAGDPGRSSTCGSRLLADRRTAADIRGVSRARAMVAGTADIMAARVMAEVDIALRATVDRMAATVAEAEVVADTPAAVVVTPVAGAAATPEAGTAETREAF